MLLPWRLDTCWHSLRRTFNPYSIISLLALTICTVMVVHSARLFVGYETILFINLASLARYLRHPGLYNYEFSEFYSESTVFSSKKLLAS